MKNTKNSLVLICIACLFLACMNLNTTQDTSSSAEISTISSSSTTPTPSTVDISSNFITLSSMVNNMSSTLSSSYFPSSNYDDSIKLSSSEAYSSSSFTRVSSSLSSSSFFFKECQNGESKNLQLMTGKLGKCTQTQCQNYTWMQIDDIDCHLDRQTLKLGKPKRIGLPTDISVRIVGPFSDLISADTVIKGQDTLLENRVYEKGEVDTIYHLDIAQEIVLNMHRRQRFMPISVYISAEGYYSTIHRTIFHDTILVDLPPIDDTPMLRGIFIENLKDSCEYGQHIDFDINYSNGHTIHHITDDNGMYAVPLTHENTPIKSLTLKPTYIFTLTGYWSDGYRRVDTQRVNVPIPENANYFDVHFIQPEDVFVTE